MEVKFPLEWQYSSLTMSGSLELASIWLAIEWRLVGNDDPAVLPPSFYPSGIQDISTERLTAWFDWLVACAMRNPGQEPWVRLEEFARADQAAASRKQRRAAKLKNKSLKKRPDSEVADLPPAQPEREGTRRVTFEVTPRDFQTIALDFVAIVFAGGTSVVCI